MTQADIEDIRARYEAVSRGDRAAMYRDVHPGFTLKTPDRVPNAGTYLGAEEATRFMEDFWEPFEEVNVEPQEFLESGDRSSFSCWCATGTGAAVRSWRSKSPLFGPCGTASQSGARCSRKPSRRSKPPAWQGRHVAAESGALRLDLNWVLPAPRTVVFRACTEPDELAKWWGPSGFTTPSVEFDPRVGGSYRIAMQPPEGDLFYLAGEFREVDPPGRIVYTFRWEDPDPDDQETLVTLSLLDLGESTELVLSQGPFLTEARLALHRGGWTDGLGRLESTLGT